MQKRCGSADVYHGSGRDDPPARRFNLRSGFTLLELLLVCIITTLLVSIVYAAFGQARAKAESVACISNMRSLHVAFEIYLHEHNRIWPQPPPADNLDVEAKWWMKTVEEYGPNQDTWRCRSRKRQDPVEPSPAGMLPKIIDYLPALFDELPGTPYKWSQQPWLMEVGDFHGGGNLILVSSGQVISANSILPAGK